MYDRLLFPPVRPIFSLLFVFGLAQSQAQSAPCAVGSSVIVQPGDHPATVLQASGGSCRVHYKDGAFPDGWTYNFNITKQARGKTSLCIAGNHVLVDPGGHPATVLQGTEASCRVHYEDAAFPDGWTYTFNIKAAGKDAVNTAADGGGLQLGRYDITVGQGASDGYLVLKSASSYELFLPGGKSGGSGSYSFDASSSQIRWGSGPLTDPTWDGTQKLEHDGSFTKIRIGKRTVATLKAQ